MTDVVRTWAEFEASPSGISVSLYESYENGEVGLVDELWLTHAEAMTALDMDDTRIEEHTLG